MFPFIAAFSQAGGIIIDKIILTRRQVALHVYTPILFLFLFILTAILFPFLGNFSLDILKTNYILIFIGMLISGVLWNVFYYRGVQSEKVHEFELIMMFQPLFTIFLATIFLKGERNLHIEIAAIIAAIFLIVAHFQKKHLEFSSGAVNLIIAVVFMSIELILIDILLEVFSPVALYCIRTGIIGLFFIIFYHPYFKKVAFTNYSLILGTAALGTIQMVSKFYGFQEFGVVYTSLILIISPILVYIISTLFLHEFIKLRTVISTVVILGCIIYATVMGR